MAMTLRLTVEEHAALRQRAEKDGASMQETARRAIRQYLELEDHRTSVLSSASRVMSAHADALTRLGE
ncbi:MAG: ribbon-helix-helix protein, CopG family [Actinobacteria bacterium]|nr:ribbon-helix-helix protein, CopG family [Actinomycetota bacterium]